MTIAEEIAATLTPSNIDTLRNPEGNPGKLFCIKRWDPSQRRNISIELFSIEIYGKTTLSELGHEVLAVIEKERTT